LNDEERTLVRIDELLPTLVESFRLRQKGKGPAFDVAIADGDVTVFASADRLTQAFENLIDNAISFSPSDSRIAVSLRSEGDLAVITIADQGPGIPAEHRDRVFSRFFSYRPNGDSDHSHTGLGLALVRAIVESYGGAVTAEARSGGGTKMIVVLPLDRGPFKR
jgi:two-component system sensor histidine kinase ChvG